jgi:hypothetical protein
LAAGGTGAGGAGRPRRLHAYVLAAALLLLARRERADDLSEERLWEQYKNCLDEYHFQVDLNWRRAQYYFVLSAALLAAGVGLRADVPAGVTIAVSVASALVAALALFANATGHNYYRSTRDTKARLEARLNLEEFALTPTAGMGSKQQPLGKVRHFQAFMLWVLIAAAVYLAGATAVEHVGADDPDPVRVALTVNVAQPESGGNHPIVVSRVQDDGEKIVTEATVRPDAPAILKLRPGTYKVSALVRAVCEQELVVTSTPLQLKTIACP